MATTVYFPSSGTPAITPAIHSGWDKTASSFIRRLMNTSGTKSNTSMTNIEYTTNTAFESYCAVQFVSAPLAAQTISGTVDFGIMARVTATGATFTALRIWVATPSGTLRGTLLQQADNTNTINSSSYTSEFRDNLALSSVVAQEGDYLVIELGTYLTNSSAKTNGLKIGDVTSASAITADSSSTTIALGNCVFTDDILFITAPTNLTYAASQGHSVNAENGVAITANVPAYSDGANATETFDISSGTLPTGITISSSTGQITGTPTVDGTYNFTVRVTNPAGSTTRAMTYQVFTGTEPDPEPEPEPEPDPFPPDSGNSGRRKNVIYVNAVGPITVPAMRPILYGILVTPNASPCRIVIKESDADDALTVVDVRIESTETRHLDFSASHGIEMSQTFEVFELTNIQNIIMYGSWDNVPGRARG